jgi:hypothetical protein
MHKKRRGSLRPSFWHKAPRVGFEPTTYRLTADRSAIELPRKVVAPKERRLAIIFAAKMRVKQSAFFGPKFILATANMYNPNDLKKIWLCKVIYVISVSLNC